MTLEDLRGHLTARLAEIAAGEQAELARLQAAATLELRPFGAARAELAALLALLPAPDAPEPRPDPQPTAPDPLSQGPDFQSV